MSSTDDVVLAEQRHPQALAPVCRPGRPPSPPRAGRRRGPPRQGALVLDQQKSHEFSPFLSGFSAFLCVGYSRSSGYLRSYRRPGAGVREMRTPCTHLPGTFPLSGRRRSAGAAQLVVDAATTRPRHGAGRVLPGDSRVPVVAGLSGRDAAALLIDDRALGSRPSRARFIRASLVQSSVVAGRARPMRPTADREVLARRRSRCRAAFSLLAPSARSASYSPGPSPMVRVTCVRASRSPFVSAGGRAPTRVALTALTRARPGVGRGAASRALLAAVLVRDAETGAADSHGIRSSVALPARIGSTP
jgi:hypothetical protein